MEEKELDDLKAALWDLSVDDLNDLLTDIEIILEEKDK